MHHAYPRFEVSDALGYGVMDGEKDYDCITTQQAKKGAPCMTMLPNTERLICSGEFLLDISVFTLESVGFRLDVTCLLTQQQVIAIRIR